MQKEKKDNLFEYGLVDSTKSCNNICPAVFRFWTVSFSIRKGLRDGIFGLGDLGILILWSVYKFIMKNLKNLAYGFV